MQEHSHYDRYATKRMAQATAHLGGKCVRCGTTDDLHFDHIDAATKVAEISRAIRIEHWSWDRLLVELAKCQLLCGPHHREKSAIERSVEHGAGASGKKNCPCAPCKKRKAEYMAAYKRRRGPGAGHD